MASEQENDKKQRGAFNAARDVATSVSGGLGRLSRLLTSGLRLPGLSEDDASAPLPGARPGIESIGDVETPPAPGEVRIHCFDYGPDRVESFEVEDLEEFLAQPAPEDAPMRWLNIDGLNPYVVDRIARQYDFHTLAAEDVLRVTQRPKLERYESFLFVVVRSLRLEKDQLSSEQVSFFLRPGLLVSFQEEVGDAWDPIRQRLQKPGSRMRSSDASYLLYAILDAVVDHCFPIVERYSDVLEELEEEIVENPTARVQRHLYALKRELSLLRRFIWPLREVVNGLQREDAEEVAPQVKAYMRDVYDHSVQLIEIVESSRELASGLNDLYMSSVSNRMNDIMKVLTIMASFFIPITFVAGVYGMNFEVIPELKWKYSYAVFWAVCLVIIATLGVYFFRKGWISRR